jgi:hypothetical protein
VLGAGVVVETIVLMFNPAAQALENPVRVALATSPLLVIVFLLVAVLGVIAQVRANRNYTLASYNRWETEPEVAP